MKITIEIDNKSELDKLVALFKELKIKAVDISGSVDTKTGITKGNKKIDPTTLFGIWADKPRSIDEIRKSGWERN